MAEGCGGAGEASAALNRAVSGEDTKEKQSMTVADGETSVEQIEGLESELSTECTEPATEAPVSEKVHLGIDNRHRYEGMEQSFADGYQPEIRDGKLYLTVPFTASGALQNECLTVDLIFAEKENAPFVFKNYQKDVKLHSYLVAGWNYDAAGNGYKRDIRKRPDCNRSAGRHCKPGRNRITCRPAGCLLLYL